MKINFKKITLITAALFAAAGAFADVKVSSVKGKCEYENNGVWEPLTEGQILSEGTKIQTGFKAELELKLLSNNENSTLTVSQLSRMTIEQLVSNEKLDKTRVALDTGKLKSEINRTGKTKVNFTIKSPVATASVRGTITTSKNVVGGTVVTTDRGNVAVCETRKMNKENLDNPDVEIVMPVGSFEVRQNQQVDMNGAGKNKTTLETASGKAMETGSVKTAAESEAITVGGNIPQTASVETKKPGSIGVTVDWE